MNLSDHFTLEELVASNTATAKGFTENFNPSEAIIDNLTNLATNVLEALRVKLGKPLVVSSGYRCPRLNAAVRGEPGSQHLCNGGSAAADITCPDMDVQDLYDFVRNSGVPIDEVIYETDSRGDWWVHVSYDSQKTEQRGICMKGVLRDGGGTTCIEDGLCSFKGSA